jgi:DNA-binding NarL/FixJ family response regulator
MVPKILIADDHALIRQGIKALLEQNGECHVCCEAPNGLEAVRLAKQCKHDVIILDLLMPNLNGLNAAKEIRRSVPGVPIVLHTLYGSAALGAEAKKFGVDVVVSKVGARSLKDIIQEVVGAKKNENTSQAP